MGIVDRANIDTQLNKIESLYSEALLYSPDPLIPEFYAKLYIIEVCGWIEETADAILVTGYLDRYKIGTPNNRKWVEKNYSFDYESLKKMNMNVLGLKSFSIAEAKLEKKLNSGKTFPNFSDFKGALTFLTKKRNSIAHTQIKGYTQTIAAPSTIKPFFDKSFLGLKILENEVCKL